MIVRKVLSLAFLLNGALGCPLVDFGLPRWCRGKESTCQCRRRKRCGFDPRFASRKIHWRRKWQPTPVFLSGKFHGQRSLAGYSPEGHKESDWACMPVFFFSWTLFPAVPWVLSVLIVCYCDDPQKCRWWEPSFLKMPSARNACRVFSRCELGGGFYRHVREGCFSEDSHVTQKLDPKPDFLSLWPSAWWLQQQRFKAAHCSPGTGLLLRPRRFLRWYWKLGGKTKAKSEKPV